MSFKYARTTATERKAVERATMRYLHVSVLVGMAKDEASGFIMPTRTPPGKGGTARKNPDVAKIINVGRHRRKLRQHAEKGTPL